MKDIPNYALYGERARPAWQDMLHLEWINERSELHQREIKPHQHDSLLQILYIRSGVGEVSLENSRMPFEAPCLILLPRRTVHAFTYSQDCDGPVITAAQRPLESMAGILSSELLAMIQRPRVFPLPWKANGEEPIWPLFRLIEEEADSPERGNVAAGHALLLALLMRIARLEAPAPAQPISNPRHVAVLNRFRELVDAHFRNHWSLARYAETLGVTPTTLGRICRKLTEPVLNLGGLGIAALLRSQCDHSTINDGASIISHPTSAYHASHNLYYVKDRTFRECCICLSHGR